VQIDLGFVVSQVCLSSSQALPPGERTDFADARQPFGDMTKLQRLLAAPARTSSGPREPDCSASVSSILSDRMPIPPTILSTLRHVALQ
jgi:hypothetical protein